MPSSGDYFRVAICWKITQGDRQSLVGASPSDLTYYGRGKLIRDFLGGSPEEIPERYDEVSPVNHVTPRSPPVFLYHGEKDTLVNPDHSREMLVELEKYHVPHEMRWIPGKGHIAAFFMPGGSVDEAIGFLDRYLK